ncbi:MAG TPA: acetylglutamate kinase [Fimbriimonadaceae bacterium]|nr:acetylglutamate kinase [Fimbriimonadaceae bacterium]
MNQPLPAEVLNEALPYIQQFKGHTFVIKYGGSAMTDPEPLTGVIRNVLLLQLVGIKPILVHGGGPEIDRWLARLGKEKRTVDGLRVTDEESMEIVEMALAGKANKALVSEIERAGGKAVGLSGRDGSLFVAEPISAELGRVGKVVLVNPEVVTMACSADFIPVICSVAADVQGGPLNVNADSAAAALAGALQATKLILLSDTDGVFTDKEDASTLMSSLTPDQAQDLISTGRADQGMIPKLEAALAAIEDGVPYVHFLNGSVPNAVLVEVFTDQGIGTMMTRVPS